MINLTESNFAETVAREELTLVDFYSNQCGPCRLLAPILEGLQDQVTVCKVSTDTDYELAMKFNISAVPTILLFKGGNVVGKMIGLQTKEKIEAMIKDLK